MLRIPVTIARSLLIARCKNTSCPKATSHGRSSRLTLRMSPFLSLSWSVFLCVCVSVSFCLSIFVCHSVCLCLSLTCSFSYKGQQFALQEWSTKFLEVGTFIDLGLLSTWTGQRVPGILLYLTTQLCNYKHVPNAHHFFKCESEGSNSDPHTYKTKTLPMVPCP